MLFLVVLLLQTLAAVDSLKSTGPVDEEDATVDGEFRRQRQYMERSVACLQRKAMRDAQKAEHVVAVRMKENAILIEQLNDLRRENLQLTGRLNATQVLLVSQLYCCILVMTVRSRRSRCWFWCCV